MKKIKLIATLAVSTLFFTACNKEEATSPTNTTSQSVETDMNAERIMKSAYAKIQNIEKGTLKVQIDNVREELTSKLTSDKSGEELIQLGDIFTLYEAAINSTFPEGEPQDGGETYESSFDVPVQEMNGDYYVSEIDFANFYLALQADMNTQLDPNNGEYYGLADLTLTSISESIAVVGVSFVIKESVPLFIALTPNGSVYGAELAGWCVANNPGIDAATFKRNYVNGKTQFAQNPTPQRYVIYQVNYHTLEYSSMFALGMDTYVMYHSLWKSATNDCIGDDVDGENNNQIWYNHFQAMDYYAGAPLPYLHANYSTLTQFLWTDFKSARATDYVVDPYYNMNFHHEGRFYYGLCVVC
jgi:hypothetical protein